MYLRAPRRDEAEAVLAVIVARDSANIGRADYTLQDVLDDWDLPGVELARDVFVCRGQRPTDRRLGPTSTSAVCAGGRASRPRAPRCSCTSAAPSCRTNRGSPLDARRAAALPDELDPRRARRTRATFKPCSAR
jgi:hypothetical protein